MIQLPEIETIRRDLERDCVGKKIKTIEVTKAKIAGGPKAKSAIEKELDQSKVESVSRVGKFLLFELSNEMTLAIELGSGGQISRVPNKTEVHPKTQLILTFTQTGQMRLIDHVGEASVSLHETAEVIEDKPELAELGIDPIEHSQRITWGDFAHYLQTRKAKLKTLLIDDSFVIGAIYLDGGWLEAKVFVIDVLGDRIEEFSKKNNEDSKSRLKMIFEKQSLPLPRYSIHSDGPDHEKIFFASIHVGDNIIGKGKGNSKKEAEQAAATEALKKYTNE